MSKIHELNCAEDRRNVGFGGCVLDWKIIAGAFIFDNPKIFTAEELANLQDTLQTLSWTDDKPNRCYPVHQFVNPADNTEAPTIQTFSDGSKAFVRDGTYDWSFQFTAGGFSLLKALASHDSNGNTYVLFYDKENKIMGYNNNGKLAAIPMQIFKALPWKMNTGSAAAEYKIQFVFASNYANIDSDFVRAGFTLAQVVGLKDVRPILLSWDQESGIADVQFVNETDGANLYDTYSSVFDDAVFTANNEETNGAITISSVTPNAGTKSFHFALSTVDADFPDEGSIVISGAAPSVLEDAGLAGYEIEPLHLPVLIATS